MAQFDLTNFNRFILDTENDADSPDNEELMQQYMYNIVGLLILMLDTGVSGTATADPTNVANSVFTDAAATWTDDLHNGHTLLMTDGACKGLFYKINDTDDAANTLTINNNLFTEGVRNGDGYKILYDLINNLDGHDHDNINSKSVALGDAVVTQAKLKSTTQSQSFDMSEGTHHKFTLTGGEYCFRPTIKGEDGWVMLDDADCVIGAAYTTIIQLYNANAALKRFGYVLHRYIQASGEVYWIFILRDKETKKIVGVSCAPDHPCMGNGGKPLLMPHPFTEFDPENQEIIVINPSQEEIREMKQKCIVDDEEKPNKDLSELFIPERDEQGIKIADPIYIIDEESESDWPTIPVTVGLPPDWQEAYLERRPVTPIKKVIPKLDYILCRSLKLR